MKPGNMMVIKDHINLMGINPLMGSDLNKGGKTEFPDMTQAYDNHLNQKMIQVLKKLNISHSKGTYCGVSGPSYETPAEIAFLQRIGVQAVGMSTVPETIVANHLGMKVCALSSITNKAAGLSEKKLSHREVIETACSHGHQFYDVLTQFLAYILRAL